MFNIGSQSLIYNFNCDSNPNANHYHYPNSRQGWCKCIIQANAIGHKNYFHLFSPDSLAYPTLKVKRYMFKVGIVFCFVMYYTGNT